MGEGLLYSKSSGGVYSMTPDVNPNHTVKAMSSPDLVTSDDKYINSYRQ
jgi:hypothetical protein